MHCNGVSVQERSLPQSQARCAAGLENSTQAQVVFLSVEIPKKKYKTQAQVEKMTVLTFHRQFETDTMVSITIII